MHLIAFKMRQKYLKFDNMDFFLRYFRHEKVASFTRYRFWEQLSCPEIVTTNLQIA